MSVIVLKTEDCVAVKPCQIEQISAHGGFQPAFRKIDEFHSFAYAISEQLFLFAKHDSWQIKSLSSAKIAID